MFYVYRFKDKNDKIIYVGKTKVQLRVRFAQHNHLPQECYEKVHHIEYIVCPTESDMSIKEIFYINMYHGLGFAQYNTMDVSAPSEELTIGDNDEWKLYEDRLPGNFCNSINYIKGYAHKDPEILIGSDGREMRYVQNSIAGKSKYVYPFYLQDVEILMEYYITKIKESKNERYKYYHFKNIIMIALGISSPIKISDLLSLKYGDVYDENEEIKPFHVLDADGNTPIHIQYPDSVKRLLYSYRRICKLNYKDNRNEWLFSGQKKGQHTTVSAVKKSIDIVAREVGLPYNYSGESLRKTFLRFVYDASEDKAEGLACLETLTESYRHRLSFVLRYLNIYDHDKETEISEFVKDKFIMDYVETDFREIDDLEIGWSFLDGE